MLPLIRAQLGTQIKRRHRFPLLNQLYSKKALSSSKAPLENHSDVDHKAKWKDDGLDQKKRDTEEFFTSEAFAAWKGRFLENHNEEELERRKREFLNSVSLADDHDYELDRKKHETQGFADSNGFGMPNARFDGMPFERPESENDVNSQNLGDDRSGERDAEELQLKPLDFDFKSQFDDGVATGTQTALTVFFPGYVCETKTHTPEIRSMPYIWLRDHCRCGECVNLDTMQRNYDVFSAPRNIQPTHVEFEAAGLNIKWNDGHESSYKWSWLRRTLKLRPLDWYWKNKKLYEKKSFDSLIKYSPPSIDYEEIMNSEQGVASWMRLIHRNGFSYVDNCPVNPEATKKLLERICFIRETHYGGFYDFTSDLTMKDTAYTAEALDAHTDTTYFSDPAGYQMFHLLSHTNGSGGKSLLVDGKLCAAVLFKEDPEAFKILHDTKVSYHASGNEGISVKPSNFRSVLEAKFATFPWGSEFIDLSSVKWNRYDRATFRSKFKPGSFSPGKLHPTSRGSSEIRMEKWYDAARKWNEILKRPEHEYWEQLRPGRPLIFDNTRVLHGRSAFTGNRRICGGYLNRDDFDSRFRNLHFSRDEILEMI